MAVPLIVAAAVSAITTGVQISQANKQAAEGRRMLGEEAPKREIPPHLKKALATQSYLASTDVPGMEAARAMADQRAALQFDESLDYAKTSNQAQGLLEKKYAQMSDSGRDREIRNQQWKAQQMQGLQKAQSAYAEAEWSQYTENVMEPYWRKQALGQAMLTGGQANMNTAFNNASSAAVELGGADWSNPNSGTDLAARDARRDSRRDYRTQKRDARRS